MVKMINFIYMYFISFLAWRARKRRRTRWWSGWIAKELSNYPQDGRSHRGIVAEPYLIRFAVFMFFEPTNVP